MAMKEVYKNLNEQKAFYEHKLLDKKKLLQEISEEKQNISIKKIHGELYYYAQYKKDGQIRTRYLGTVVPGRIAKIEKVQSQIETLTKEIQELEWNIESLDKMLDCYKKREKKNELQMIFLLKYIGKMR